MIDDYYTTTVNVLTVSAGSPFTSEDGWTTSGTILCCLDKTSGSFAYSSDKKTEFADFKLYCSANVTLSTTNRVEYLGVRYEVSNIYNPLGKGHHIECFLKKCHE